MDQKEFIPIGIVKVLWDYDITDMGIKEAYFEYYIPKTISTKYGEEYCNRFIFLENGVAVNCETDEYIQFQYENLGFDKKTNLFKIKFLNNIIYLTEEQKKLLEKTLIDKELIKN